MDARIAALGTVCTLAELHEAGVGDESIALRLADGRLFRPYRGVYSRLTELDGTGQLRAAVLACGAGAAASHLSAATLTGVWRYGQPERPQVVAPRRRRVAGIDLTRSTTLAERDLRERGPLVHTSPARTVLDLGDLLYPELLTNVIHESAWRLQLTGEQLEDVSARNRGRRAVTVARAAAAAWEAGSAGIKSRFERVCSST